eukprot:ANDGO_04741.mRNA.1 hypothetical protein
MGYSVIACSYKQVIIRVMCLFAIFIAALTTAAAKTPAGRPRMRARMHLVGDQLVVVNLEIQNLPYQEITAIRDGNGHYKIAFGTTMPYPTIATLFPHGWFGFSTVVGDARAGLLPWTVNFSEYYMDDGGLTDPDCFYLATMCPSSSDISGNGVESLLVEVFGFYDGAPHGG